MDRIRHAGLRVTYLMLYFKYKQNRTKGKTMTIPEFIFMTSAFIIAVGFIDWLLSIFINVFKEVRYNKNHYEDRMNGFFYWLSISVIIILMATNIIIPLVPLDYNEPASTIIIFIAEAIVYHIVTKEVEQVEQA